MKFLKKQGVAWAIVIIMIVAEISVIVLKKVFCSKLSKEDREILMTGKAKTTDERIEEAKKFIAENEAVAVSADTTSEQ